jgi:hypothetical protein
MIFEALMIRILWVFNFFPIEGDRSGDHSSSVVEPNTDHDVECDEELSFFLKAGQSAANEPKTLPLEPASVEPHIHLVGDSRSGLPRPNFPRLPPRIINTKAMSYSVRGCQTRLSFA